MAGFLCDASLGTLQGPQYGDVGLAKPHQQVPGVGAIVLAAVLGV